MALHGTVGEFDAIKEDWSTYSTRLEYYFEANDIADPDKKRVIILSTSGIETFKLACNLASPRTPRELTYKELVDTISEHFHPKKSAAVHRFKFNSKTRIPGETASTFVTELKKLAVHCGFADGDELKKMLCDRLICGINDARMQRRLLAESEIDFDKAFKLVQANESADKSSQDMEKAAAASVAGVHRIALSAKPSNVQAECYRCGGNHRATTCRFRTADCRLPLLWEERSHSSHMQIPTSRFHQEDYSEQVSARNSPSIRTYSSRVYNDTSIDGRLHNISAHRETRR